MLDVYGRDQILGFLKALDKELDEPFELILIGGTAATLAYKVTRATRDIDAINDVKGLQKAYEATKQKTGVDIPLEQVSVFDAPYDYEDRLVILEDSSLTNLVIKIPEIHDLILMKTIRGYEHDFEAIQEMIEKNEVSKSTLEERIRNELGQAIGNKKRIGLNFSALLELF